MKVKVLEDGDCIFCTYCQQYPNVADRKSAFTDNGCKTSQHCSLKTRTESVWHM